jgi:hypothetical protein
LIVKSILARIGGYLLLCLSALRLCLCLWFRLRFAVTGRCPGSCKERRIMIELLLSVFKSWEWKGLVLICLRNQWVEREWRAQALRSNGSHLLGVRSIWLQFVLFLSHVWCFLLPNSSFADSDQGSLLASLWISPSQRLSMKVLNSSDNLPPGALISCWGLTESFVPAVCT